MNVQKLELRALRGIQDVIQVDENSIARSRRIFVNRNLKMKSVQAIGFDMDHTLAVYSKVPIEGLAFDETKKKMVHDLGYPERLLDLTYDPEFVIRGLVVDKARGNLIKMDRHKYAVKAYHGKRPLDRTERKATYSNKKLTVYDKDFCSIDTLFTLPEGDLFAQIIDLMEMGSLAIDRSFTQIFQDIRVCIDKAHRDNSLKSKVLAHPERYFLKDPKLALALDKFIRGGKKLFLVTNSAWDYTDRVMTYLLDGELEDYPDWCDYFHVVVVDANKPDFFQSAVSLEELSIDDDGSRNRRIRRVFRQGSSTQVEQLLDLKCDEILFIGDHTYGDILRSKKNSFWRTVMVIEELEREIESAEQVRQIFDELASVYGVATELRGQVNLLVEKIAVVRETKTQDYHSLDEEEFTQLDEECERLCREATRIECEISSYLFRAKALEEKCEQAYNPYWGQLFKAGRENSRFGDQVEDFACLYTVRVSNFLYYPSNKYFQTTRRVMAHEV